MSTGITINTYIPEGQSTNSISGGNNGYSTPFRSDDKNGVLSNITDEINSGSGTKVSSVSTLFNAKKKYNQNKICSHNGDNSLYVASAYKCPFFNLTIRNSLTAHSSCSFDLILDENDEKPPIQFGDIIEIIQDQTIKFTGYITSYVFTKNEYGYILRVQGSHFIQRTKETSFLYSLALVANKNAETVSKVQRKVGQAFANCKQNSMLEYCNMYIDMTQKACFSGMFNTSTTSYEVMAKVSNQYMRNIITRFGGEVFITLLNHSNSVSEFFSYYDESDLNILSLSISTNYDNLTYKTRLVYENSVVINNHLTTAEVLFKDYPYQDNMSVAVPRTEPTMFPETNDISILNCNFVFGNEVFELNPITMTELNNGGKITKDLFATKIVLDTIRSFYNRIKGVKLANLITTLDGTSNTIDVGDTIRIEGELYSVIYVSNDYQLATQHLITIPMKYTNPSIFPLEGTLNP